MIVTVDDKIESIKLLFNNHPDAIIIQIYSVIKLYIFRASSLPIIRSFPLYLRLPRRVRMEHPDSAWKRSSKLHETYPCRNYSGKLPMMGREDARNI